MRIFKVALMLVMSIALLAVLLYALLLSKKDIIGRKFLDSLSENLNFEVSFEDVEVSIFENYPEGTLILNEVKVLTKDSIESPLIELHQLHLTLNVQTLFGSNIEVSSVKLERGKLYLKEYADGSFNLLTALESNELPHSREVSNMDTLKSSNDSNYDLSLSQMVVSDFQVIVDRQLEELNDRVAIKNLKGSFKYMGDSIKCSLDSDFEVQRFRIGDLYRIDDQNLSIMASIVYNTHSDSLLINDGTLAFSKGYLDLSGSIDLEEKLIDIDFVADDSDLKITSLVLTPKATKGIRSGSLYLSGDIKGSFQEKIPVLNCKFGIEDFALEIPEVNSSIKNFNIKGDFNSGDKMDLSSANLSIDTLFGEFSNGYIAASAAMRNFQEPSLQFELFLETQLRELDEILNLPGINELDGTITIKDKYAGHKEEEQWVDDVIGNMEVNFDSVSFNLDSVMRFDLIHGVVSGYVDSIELKDLVIHTSKSDFKLNGRINHARDISLDRGNEITANLTIQSSNYSFPEFWQFMPHIGKKFPYAIKDLSLTVRCSTSHQELNEYISMPGLSFEIKELSAKVPGFLPQLNIHQGQFQLKDGPDKSDFYGLKDFNVQVDTTFLNGNFQYFDFFEPDSMIMQVGLNDFNPGNLQLFGDTTIAESELVLNGQFDAYATYAENDEAVFEKVKISSDSLLLKYFQYDLECIGLKIEADAIDYQTIASINSLNTLKTTLAIKINHLKTPWFQEKDFRYDINANRGEFSLSPHKVFETIGSGQLIIKPFVEPPTYELNYSVKQFPAYEYIKDFYTADSITGKLNLAINLSSQGNDWRLISHNLTGTIDLNGTDIYTYGTDINPILDKVSKAQKFKFTDLGTLTLFSPVGLMAIKGAKYIGLNNLINTKDGETHILQFKTLFNVDKGRFDLYDGAFSTKKHRVAAKGWFDLRKDSLDLNIALVNKYGCNIVNQSVTGIIGNPDLNKVKLLNTLTKPLSYTLKGKGSKNCDPFYVGSVSHPKSDK